METTKTRLSLGIDIGTTTISAALLDIDTGILKEARTIQSEAAIPSEHSWDKRQDAGKIEANFTNLITSLLERYPDIVSVGFTGQMHGILYLDADGNAVSPLYTWQDERAGQGSPSTCEKILQRTGYTIPTGYGLATHLALADAGEVPKTAVCLCTIMDYLAMKLCGLKRPVLHTSNAAGLGFFPVGGRDFDREAVEKAGIDPALLPEVTPKNRILGVCGAIPVSAAIGDNQASFLGAVREPEHTALANFGTGSQISVMVSRPETVPANLEVRPWLGDTCLMRSGMMCSIALLLQECTIRWRFPPHSVAPARIPANGEASPGSVLRTLRLPHWRRVCCRAWRRSCIRCIRALKRRRSIPLLHPETPSAEIRCWSSCWKRSLACLS